MKYIYIYLTIILFYGCSSMIDDKIVIENVWEYQNGYKAQGSDFIEFDKDTVTFTLDNHDIFYNGKLCAHIKNANINELIIISAETGEIGEYINSKH